MPIERSSSAPSSTQNGVPSPTTTIPWIGVSGPSKRPLRKSLSRPSTAPAKEDVTLLPSGPQESLRYISSDSKTKKPELFHHMQTVEEDEYDSTLGTPPSPFDRNVKELIPSTTGDGPSVTNQSDCDWATFVSAYASGRWDPHRTPNPPRSYIVSSSSSPPDSAPILYSHEIASTDNSRASQSNPELNAGDFIKPELPGGSTSTLSLSPSATMSFNRFRPLAPIKLPLPAHRMRNSFSTSPSSSQTPTDMLLSSSAHSNSEVQTTVATMRWAAARVDISPLALPSPEHELTDPMRGVMAAVPGAHLPDVTFQHDHPLTPGGTRKPRLTEFWHGTTDVDSNGVSRTMGPSVGSTRLAPIAGSPADSTNTDTPPKQDRGLSPFSGEAPSALSHLNIPPPASAPAADAYHSTSETIPGDYFGDVNIGGSTSKTPPSVPVVVRSATPLTEMGTVSVPALPRRVCLTRQMSSPLPISSPREPRYPGGRVASETITSVKAGRAAKEEQMFGELGYLAPPNPPDELERRRALYKFNIWNTGPDLNFDRIAHLAKLVFNTKGVVISLIDGNEQWFKSEWGIKTPSCARIHAFCAHSILQRGDEPMVILDTFLDWRFAKNPLVVGDPNIRFYAGAPLRTQDGFNIGTLAVIDDAPREDFLPRHRHTLKEFAAIAMREMELWRDKIQLRIRDRIQNSMEQFSRECLEIDTEAHAQNKDDRPDLIVGSSMDKVYDRAAKLVKRTLDVEGVIVMDVSHCEVLESMSAEGSVSVIMHHGDPQQEATERQLSSEEYHKLNEFFAKHPDGKISEGIVPPSFRPFLPTRIQYALTVPIYNIDKRPFALLCAYTVSDQTKRYLEGHELSYLRAIGVIILSAVLKRRMILADKAKSLFISNISHELRTPLHGILAAAELLSDSYLNHSQLSFLQTVQACGTSLVETVNHVLDFTKLSGNAKAGGVENVIVPSKVDLMQLVEEAVDGCWIGHRARTAITGDSGIGSVYSPPKEDRGSPVATRRAAVETVVEVGYRREGWGLRCEKGGIRRVLMNVFGNSLKFTKSGFVHVLLRELSRAEDDPPNKVKIELAVLDTGKGISQNFLKNQLFHPFSQENPLQTGTGLGLAIVNSIVTSESVGGKVEVWSEEGSGTEIKVTFSAERLEDEEASPEMELFKVDDLVTLPTISLVGFDSPHEGTKLLNVVLRTYLTSWWGLKIATGHDYGDIIILNDDPVPISAATERHDISRPFIILSAARGNPTVMAIASEHERIGGFCRILYKPGGPSRLRSILKLCLHALKIGSRSRGASPEVKYTGTGGAQQYLPMGDEKERSGSGIPRRNSEENHTWSRKYPSRPAMSPRSSTASPAMSSWQALSSIAQEKTPEPDPVLPTISIGTGGSLLKSSVGTVDTSERRFRVLVVEDNSILRNLLIKWLSQKGYDFRDAVDGRDGVSVYESDGPFDVVLLDLSMPILDGVAATAEIRHIESTRLDTPNPAHPTRILALTGMSSLEDKRRAFDAGVDGYLVKPVAFKTLDEMFQKLGIT